MPRQSCNWMPHLQPQAPHMTLQDGQSTARLQLTICVLGQLGATVYLIGHGGCAGLPNGDGPDNPLQQLEVIRLSCQICFGLAAALTNVCSQKIFFSTRQFCLFPLNETNINKYSNKQANGTRNAWLLIQKWKYVFVCVYVLILLFGACVMLCWLPHCDSSADFSM